MDLAKYREIISVKKNIALTLYTSVPKEIEMLEQVVNELERSNKEIERINKILYEYRSKDKEWLPFRCCT